MMSDRPVYLGEALRQRGYLVSSWPWRALLYTVTTVPISGILSVGLMIVGSPLMAVAQSVRHDRPVKLAAVLCLGVIALITLALAPLATVLVTEIERWRLGLVDRRHLPGQRFRGLAARYTTAAAWREVAYTFWLGGIVPIGYGILALFTMLDVAMITSPWLASDAERITMVVTTVDAPDEAVPYAIAGILFVPVLWYLLGLLVAAQAAVARWLLGAPQDGTALREVTRSRARLVDAYEAERRRIERDVHDGAQPRLTSLTLQLGLARLDVPDDSPAAGPLAVAHGQAKDLMVLLRQIAQGIRPQHLTELGLAGAVRDLAGVATVPVDVRADLDGPVPELIETTAYFMVSESLGNVARHARATRAEVRLTRAGHDLVVEVEDDGCGGADPARGTGLTGLADRVAAVDGRLLLSSPPGGPTLVRVELPCRP